MNPPIAARLAEQQAIATVVADALDLADSVSDLLLAEGMYQIVQGNPERAAAAMAVADKQSLPIETQVDRTPRGGASYTQRIAVLCPAAAEGWPEDRRSRAEPAVNAWIASMLGDPAPLSIRGDRASHRQRRQTGYRSRTGDRDLGRSRDLAAVGRDARRGGGRAAPRRSSPRPAFAASSRRR